MKTFTEFVFEALRAKPDSPLMQRAISNMPKDSDVDKEFAKHTAELSKQADTDDFDKYDESEHAALNWRRHDPSKADEDKVQSAASHPISKPMTFFRGLGKSDPLNQRLSSGGVKPGETAGTVGGGTAYGRRTPKIYGSGSVLVIHAQPGTRGAHMSGIFKKDDEEEGVPSEREVLLRNTPGKYLGSETINGRVHHHVEVGGED